ncbi:MAG: DUF86 domain-containing protein [Actinomycetota bacterium]|nr:DUF86 domain-containing protein [Actinomycetota bacterium]
MEKLKPVSAVSLKEFLEDTVSQDITERNLQIAIQVCLDIGTHIISSLGLERPKDYKDVFSILGKEGIIPSQFASKIAPMAGFRNILVHDYIEIDLNKVYSHLQKLEDFNRFAQYISEFASKET